MAATTELSCRSRLGPEWYVGPATARLGLHKPAPSGMPQLPLGRLTGADRPEWHVAATTETPGRSEPGLSGMWDRPLEALEAMKLRRVACGSYH